MAFWSNVGSFVGGLFGGGDSGGGGSSGGAWGNVFEAILGGVEGYSTAKLDKETAKELGKEGRRSLEFERNLEDYYRLRDRQEKMQALRNYSQFSSLDQFAPNYRNQFTPTPVPEKPRV